MGFLTSNLALQFSRYQGGKTQPTPTSKRSPESQSATWLKMPSVSPPLHNGVSCDMQQLANGG